MEGITLVVSYTVEFIKFGVDNIIKCKTWRSNLPRFRNAFGKFNVTAARMFDSIYHTLQITKLKTLSYIFARLFNGDFFAFITV